MLSNTVLFFYKYMHLGQENTDVLFFIIMCQNDLHSYLILLHARHVTIYHIL